jgi:[ribosomal protein S5]-alanine N-acetyltransferase
MIETPRLILRKMVMDDIDGLLAIFTDPAVMASFGGIIFTREQMTQWINRNLDHQDKHGYGLFSVILKSEGKLIGDCGLEHTELDGEPMVELGYDFNSNYWHMGYATESASAVRDYAFNTLGLGCLVSMIRIGNKASANVAERVGMSQSRTFKKGELDYWLYKIEKQGNTIPVPLL